MYMNNCGVRKTALFMGCSPGTILNWVREAAANIEPTNAIVEDDVIEMDEIYAHVDRRMPNSVKKNGIT